MKTHINTTLKTALARCRTSEDAAAVITTEIDRIRCANFRPEEGDGRGPLRDLVGRRQRPHQFRRGRLSHPESSRGRKDESFARAGRRRAGQRVANRFFAA